MDYDIYGAPQFYTSEGNNITNSIIENKILFTGREYEKEYATYYFRARIYNTKIGRFMQHDSLLYINGMNDFSYVFNNPISFIDPYGLDGMNVNGPRGHNWNLFKQGQGYTYHAKNLQTWKNFNQNIFNASKNTELIGKGLINIWKGRLNMLFPIIMTTPQLEMLKQNTGGGTYYCEI